MMRVPATILVLDNSLTVLASTQYYLESKGYQVFTATNQELTMQLLANEDIDLLVLDWDMPDHNGLDIVRCLRCNWKYFDLPIILMTGKSESKCILSAMNAGCDDFVSKEDGVELLEVRIQRLLFFLQRLEIQKTSRKERHILLVDDCKTFLLSTQQFLKPHFKVSAVQSGQEALQLLEQAFSATDSANTTGAVNTTETPATGEHHLAQSGDPIANPIDLLVVDWMMPEMSGLELIREIRENPYFREIPIIMLSGKDSLEDVTAAIEMGADDFINKEADLKLLEKKIDVLLRIQEQYRRYTRQIMQEKQKVESLVQQRTQELVAANDELKATQTQLVHAEKMSSLGQLVAGVAHEINNPLSFIQNNLFTIREDVESIQGLLTYYRDFGQTHQDQDTLKQLHDYEQDLDLEYTTQELGDCLTHSEQGTERIQQIVLNMRNFSRLDEGEIKRANLYEGIDNALLMLNHQLNGRIKINKEWEDLPEIECAPGQLNQVFMNLLSNSIHAIDGDGEITIRGRKQDDHINLEFCDTGCGIPEKFQSKLFDPFFTTKPVGQGTGLGLSIAYRIIKNHQGSIEIASKEGHGSVFSLTLPIEKAAGLQRSPNP
ncbi:response regulator [Litoribrevibacter euphylliae]|uniref:histidine kinase n=1 Tax=Litoribrevibacter euphylliae TaxID=1834034 RepID=A0ABV7HAM4_9GAMM